MPRAGQQLDLEGRTDHEVSRRTVGSTQRSIPKERPSPGAHATFAQEVSSCKCSTYDAVGSMFTKSLW